MGPKDDGKNVCIRQSNYQALKATVRILQATSDHMNINKQRCFDSTHLVKSLKR